MIQYVFRNRKAGYSIAKVFNTFIPNIDNYEKLELPFARASLLCVLQNALYLIRHKRKGALYHLTGNVEYCALFLPKKRTILTIHDLVLLNHNKYGKIKKIVFFYLWHYYPLKRAGIITCISEKTRNDLLHFFPWANHKVVVIPNPVDPAIKYFKKAFNKQNPVILHVGTRENKNLERVAEALSGIKCVLRVVGEMTESQIKIMDKYRIEYENVHNLSDEEIRDEYYKSDIISFPSTYEGFGMPIVEGYAAGRIVVTSNISPMIDIAEDASIFVNPFDTNSIREGFLHAIEADKERDTMIEKGLHIAQKYSVHIIANQYQTLYEQFLRCQCHC